MRILLHAVVCAFLILALSFPEANCEDRQDNPIVAANGSKISVHADKIPLGQVLSELAGISALNIYLAPSLSEIPVTASFDNLPVEKAVRRLLKDFNYLASFKKEKDKDRLVTLKIYPKGTSSGALVHIDTTNRAEEIGDIPMHPENMGNGQESSAPDDNRMRLDSPETPEEAQEMMDNPLMAIQQQFEAEKQHSLEEQIKLQRLIEATDDPKKKEGLQVSYAEEIARFKKLEDAFTNKIESLKRLQEFSGEQQ